MMKRGTIITDKLVIWLIVFGCIVLLLIVAGLISGKLGAIGELIKTWLRFG
ncbi:MAG: hypothetical protein KJ600_02265 [Nanoarchaeota archaeon]|nr:hypothetical protein [Nanoarchaeota archaeon]MBU1103359.1 hypothetical protein [Nanoarchaeota archaeon]